MTPMNHIGLEQWTGRIDLMSPAIPHVPVRRTPRAMPCLQNRYDKRIGKLQKNNCRNNNYRNTDYGDRSPVAVIRSCRLPAILNVAGWGLLCLPVPHFQNAHDPAGFRCNPRLAAPLDATINTGRRRSESHSTSELRNAGRRRPEWYSDQRVLHCRAGLEYHSDSRAGIPTNPPDYGAN